MQHSMRDMRACNSDQAGGEIEFSEVEVSSPEIAVGDEANIMCNIYNLGRTKLYNVKAKFEGEGIKGKEVFVGHVESGSSAAIDGMVTGEKETTGDGRMKMIVTYEDEAGAPYSTEQEFQLLVTPKQEDAGMVFSPETEPEKKGFPILPVGIAVVILAGGIAAVIIVRRKNKESFKKRRRAWQMSLIDLLRMSSGNLKRRKLRTFLTVLGVVIGTASIVVMISLGLGMQKSMYKQVEESGGITNIDVTGKNNGGGGVIVSSDMMHQVRSRKNTLQMRPSKS